MRDMMTFEDLRSRVATIRDVRALVLALGALALCGVATASTPPAVLESRDVKLQPSGAQIRLIVSKANLDQKRAGRVALLLALYRRADIGYRKVKTVRVATGYKLSSRLLDFSVDDTPGTGNVAIVHLKWLANKSTRRTYTYTASATRLRPHS